MRFPFLWRIYAACVLLILLVAGVTGGTLYNRLLEDRISLSTQGIYLLDYYLENTLISGADVDTSALRNLSDHFDGGLLIVDGKAKPIFSVNFHIPGVLNLIPGSPEFSSAMKHESTTRVITSASSKEEILLVTEPVILNGEVIAITQAATSLTQIRRDTITAFYTPLKIIIIAALLAVAIALFAAIRFVQFFSSISEGARAISKGDFDHRVYLARNDEFGQLAEIFNELANNASLRMKQLVDDRNKISAIIEGMVEGVVATDPSNRIIHVNEAASRILGALPGNSLGKPYWQVIRHPEINKTIETAMKEGTARARIRIATFGNDKVIDIFASTMSHYDDRDKSCIVVLHDISELAHLETIRQDFVVNASHELKTPITAIRGIIETVLHDKHMEEETKNKFLEKIQSQIVRLSSIVTDLMALSRLDSENDTGNHQPLDLKEIAVSSKLAYSSLCAEKGILLECEIPSEKVMLRGDPYALGQMVDNLLDNALKYTPKGGKIRLSLTKNLEDSTIELIVQDNGIGVSPDEQQRIFERFYRVDKARSIELGGTGLGLSIVKHIVESHSGSISLESQLGKGSSFKVILPLIQN